MSDHAATAEQIEANIERAASLAEAENAEGLAELAQETEALISSLPSRGRLEIEGRESVTFAAAKKDYRDRMRAASLATPKEEVATSAQSADVAVVKSFDEFDGVPELVAMGAEKVAEGVRLHIKTSTTAKEIAHIILDMWRRIPNKDGHPDLTGSSVQAKSASSALYQAAGSALAGEDEFDVQHAVKRLIRSVQFQRTDVRAEYLRSLDDDSEDAAEERKHFAELLKGKPEGEPVSEFLARSYGVSLKGEIEKARERYRNKAELTAGDDSEAELTSPDDEIRSVVRRLRADVSRVRPEAFEQASEEVKTEVRTKLLELQQAVKDMITATL